MNNWSVWVKKAKVLILDAVRVYMCKSLENQGVIQLYKAINVKDSGEEDILRGEKISPWSIFTYALVGLYKGRCPTVRIPNESRVTLEKRLLFPLSFACTWVHVPAIVSPIQQSLQEQPNFVPVSFFLEASPALQDKCEPAQTQLPLFSPPEL